VFLPASSTEEVGAPAGDVLGRSVAMASTLATDPRQPRTPL